MNYKISFFLSLLFFLPVDLLSQPTTADSLFTYGKDYFNNGEFRKALIVLGKAEAAFDSANARNKLPGVYEYLAKAFAKTGNYKAAYFYFDACDHLKDSLQRAAALQKEDELVSKYENELKENKARWLAAENNQKAEEEAQQKKLENIYTVAGGLIFLLVLILMFMLVLKIKSSKQLWEKNKLVQKERTRADEIELSKQHLIDDFNRQINEIIKEEIRQEGLSGSDDGGRSVTETILPQAIIEDDITVKNQNLFSKSITNDIEKIEAALKLNDWQTIKQTVSKIQVQLMDAGLLSGNELFPSFESFDGKTSHRTWFENTTAFCKMVRAKKLIINDDSQ